MAKSGPTKKSENAKSRKQGVVDKRFAAAQSDPRFQRFPRSKAKVAIDDRFAGMFDDQSFQLASAVDKRGRKIGKQKRKEDLRRYYRLQDEEEDWGKDADAEPQGPNAADLRRPETLEAKLHEEDMHAGLSAETNAPVAAREEKKQAGKGDQPGSRSDRKKARSARPDPIDSAPSDSGTSDEAAAPQRGSESSSSSSGGSDDSAPLDDEGRHAADRWARVRGMTGPQASSSDEESSEALSLDAEDSEQDLDLSEWGVGALAANPDEKVPEISEETSRLAILDLDWTKVKAVDIYAMLSSFLTGGKSIQKVTVYPSDYGIERMAEEARFGPISLFEHSRLAERLQQEQQQDAEPSEELPAASRPVSKSLSAMERAAVLETLNEESSDDEEAEAPSLDGNEEAAEEQKLQKERQQSGAQASARESADDAEAARRLQLYERSRLRYFYAIVECSDVAAAAQLYRECDGMEFEHSASTFDLRYVPESQEFGGRKMRDEASGVPSGYKPPDVRIGAMLHTRPKLTWDDDDDDRRRTLSRRLTKEQLRDDDFKAYLGSESEEHSEPGEADRERYHELLAQTQEPTGRGESRAWRATAASDEEGADGEEADGRGDRDMELQVTFGGGLDELSERLKARLEGSRSRGKDTLWEAYLKRRKEKKMEAKRRGRKYDSDVDDDSDDPKDAERDPYFRHDEDVFEDPFFKDADGTEEKGTAGEGVSDEAALRAERKAKKLAGKEAAAAARQRAAELELLLMDDAALKDASKIGSKSEAEPDVAGKPKGRLSRKARLAAKKAAKAARRAESDDEDAQLDAGGGKFAVNVEDRRFDALFTNPEFAIDPTDARYKAGEGTSKIMQEATKRRKAVRDIQKTPQPNKTAAAVHTTAGTQDGLKSLVASLKRKGAGDQSRKANASKRQRA